MPTERSLDFEQLDRFEQLEVLVDICQINFQKSCTDLHCTDYPLCQWIRSLSHQYLCISKVEHYRLFAHLGGKRGTILILSFDLIINEL